MGKKGRRSDPAELRRRAESRMRGAGAREPGPESPAELQRVVEELRVHQIELELQNEELQQTRDDLEGALSRYADLYDFAPVGYLTFSRDGVIRKANLTAARLLELERSRLVGRSLGLFLTDETRPIFLSFLAASFEGEARASCEVAVSTERKETHWVQIQGAADEAGTECRAAFVEITERHRFEQILLFRVALLEWAVNRSIPEVLEKTLDEIGVLTASPVCILQLLDEDQETPSQQVCSRQTTEALGALRQGGRYPIDTTGAWQECLRDRRPVVRDRSTAQRRKGLAVDRGAPALVRELLVPILRSERIVAVVSVGDKPTDYVEADTGLVALLADLAWGIVERKRAEQALEASQRHSVAAAEALSEAARQKDQFLAMLSHELRNPLAPITNSLHILERVEPGGDTAKRAHAVIGRQVEHMTRLIDDLLDVTRVARGKIRLQRQPLDLREIVNHTAEDHRPTFVKLGLELEVVAPDEAVPIDADPTRMTQIIGNLLTNAEKFTPRGGRVTIEVRREAESGEAVVKVRDTGSGITADMLGRIFEAFVQADHTVARSRGGLGIGLALVKGLVEMHGGSVAARSEGPSRGAELCVRLPLREGLRPERRRGHKKPQKGPRRVLLVEDNVDMADTLRVALELDGHQVQVAHEGMEGVRKAREFRPDVALCDIGLPEMDGYAVARVFRADQALRSTYLVALTGFALSEDEAKAREAGFDEHISKPPDMERLGRVLADLGRSAAR